jgi:osmotically-inducible protein OsmY
VIPARFDDVDFAQTGKRASGRSDRSPTFSVPDDAQAAKQLCENIRRALLATGQMWLRDVAATVNSDGRVVLQGRVPTYYLKQLAQSVALAVVGVKALENQIAVQ